MSLRYIFVTLCGIAGLALAQSSGQSTSRFPCPEKLSYRVEWHLINAGAVSAEMAHTSPDDWETKLHLESAGVVTRLYHVLDNYRVATDDKFCGINSTLDAQEGKRHTLTHLVFEKPQHKVAYEERDLLKNTSVKKELDVQPCTYDIAGGLEALRQMDLQPGKWATFPMTNGKKIASVKIQAQAKEPVTTDNKTYQTIRYEAFVFDDVLYKRKGRLLIWISDDADRLPVQVRLQLGFPVGNVNVQLEKAQKS